MELSTATKNSLMRRVHLIFFARRVLPMLVVEMGVLAFALQKIAEHVFINQVLWNAVVHTLTRSPLMMISFFGQAFINTEITVQMLIVGFGIAGIFMMKDMMRSTQTLLRHNA